MVPPNRHSLFWDVNIGSFDPLAYPEYTIFRVLEHGDEHAVKWLRENFPETKIKDVLRAERRLSRRSANFWALVYQVPAEEAAALQ